MRCLLVNPWIHDFAAYDLWSKPLGLLKIATYLKKLRIDVRLIDYLDRFHPLLNKLLKCKLPKNTLYGNGSYFSQQIEKPAFFKTIPRRFKRYGYPKELFKEMINQEPRPDVILVTSAMTYWYPGVFEAIEILREHFNSIPIVLGGTYAQLCFRHAQKNSGADIVYNGSDILEILKLIAKITGKNFDFSVAEKKESVSGGYELYPKLGYVTLRTSSGCPYKCSYCG